MLDKVQYSWRMANISTRIVYINIAVFILVNLFGMIANMSGFPNYLTHYLSTTADLSQLIYRPWSIITYAFVHEGLFHILFNMLIFFYMSTLIGGILGEKRVLPLYFYGALAGWLLYFIAYNVFPSLIDYKDGSMVGASASVMAFMLASAVYFPEYEVHLFGVFKVKLKWIAGFYVLSDFVALNGFSNLGGHLAHLGGAGLGAFYAFQLKSGTDIGEYYYSFMDTIKAVFKPKPKVRVKHKAAGPRGGRPKPTEKNEQQEIDAILDKISKSGYDSLTKQEKETLFKASNS